MFLGISKSFIQGAEDEARARIAAVNRALEAAGLPAYAEPEKPPSPYVGNRFGRTMIDHQPAEALKDLSFLSIMCLAPAELNHLKLLMVVPLPVVYVPQDFSQQLESGGGEGKVFLGSAPHLLRCLVALVQDEKLAIPLQPDGTLLDVTAERINAREPLFDGDTHHLASEGLRTAWLMLYEGARLAVKHQTALALAG
jgi:hypothetical protein